MVRRWTLGCGCNTRSRQHYWFGVSHLPTLTWLRVMHQVWKALPILRFFCSASVSRAMAPAGTLTVPIPGAASANGAASPASCGAFGKIGDFICGLNDVVSYI